MCPIQAWRHLEAAPGDETGPALRMSDGSALGPTYLKKLLVAAQQAAGGPTERISAHSLRVGGASAWLAAGLPEGEIQLLGRWSADPRNRAYLRYLRGMPEAAWGGAKEEMGRMAVATRGHSLAAAEARKPESRGTASTPVAARE